METQISPLVHTRSIYTSIPNKLSMITMIKHTYLSIFRLMGIKGKVPSRWARVGVRIQYVRWGVWELTLPSMLSRSMCSNVFPSIDRWCYFLTNVFPLIPVCFPVLMPNVLSLLPYRVCLPFPPLMTMSFPYPVNMFAPCLMCLPDLCFPDV
jgi:hypothetical protein